MALDHYVSQVHLKRFYSPALGNRMYAIRKSDLKQFTPDARSVCRSDDGSSNSYLTEPRAVEEFLKTVEKRYNLAATALETDSIDKMAIYVIAGFAAYLLTCSPTAMRSNSIPLRGITEITAKMLERNGAMPSAPEESSFKGKSLTELLDEGEVKITVDPKYPQAISIASIVSSTAIMGNLHWDILINTHNDCPFFTSDFPVAYEDASDKSLVNKIIPLSPTLAVRFCPSRHSPRGDQATLDFRCFTARRHAVSRREAVAINRMLVKCAEDVVFYRDAFPWVPDFIQKNRHFRVDTEIFQLARGNAVFQQARVGIVPFRQPTATS